MPAKDVADGIGKTAAHGDISRMVGRAGRRGDGVCLPAIPSPVDMTGLPHVLVVTVQVVSVAGSDVAGETWGGI